MKRKIISWLLVVCLISSFSITAFAAETDTAGLEFEAAVRIEQMVYMYYSDYPGYYEVGEAVTIYNADVACVYYIVPIFRNQNCVGTVEVDASGNVSLTNETTVYTGAAELSASECLLYTSGGIVYVEYPDDVVALYDSGFSITVTNNFTSLSYADKAALIESCIDTTATVFDITTVVEEVDAFSIANSGISLFGAVPQMEVRECAITNFVTQGSYEICWAACVATIVNYKTGRNLTAVDVANRMGHNYTVAGYRGADEYETANALLVYGVAYCPTGMKASWQNIKSWIGDDSPLIIGLRSSLGKHMVTAYRYECRYGDADMDSSFRCVHVWDPNGAQRVFLYNASSYSINGYSWTWVETLVP